MDKRVEIHGTSRADMNGKRGVAIDFHPMGGPNELTTWRYTVQLDGGEAFKLKPANVRAEHTIAEKLYEMALWVVKRTTNAVDPSNAGPWPPLSMSQQKEMEAAIVMMQEAMDKVSGRV